MTKAQILHRLQQIIDKKPKECHCSPFQFCQHCNPHAPTTEFKHELKSLVNQIRGQKGSDTVLPKDPKYRSITVDRKTVLTKKEIERWATAPDQQLAKEIPGK